MARTQYEFAVLLSSRHQPGDRNRALELLARALETTKKLGMTTLREKVMVIQREIADLGTDDAQAFAGTEFSAGEATRPVLAKSQPHEKPSVQVGVLRKEGDYWMIAYEGNVFRLRDTVGLRYLAQLLSNPGREFLATDLRAAVHGDWAPAPTSSFRAIDKRESRIDFPYTGPEVAEAVLDPQARMAYKRRLEELREDLEQAQTFNDLERAARLQAEIEFLGEELARAAGLGGRDRKTTSQVERARLSVTRAIRIAVRNIATNHDSLGSYLGTSIKTGIFCSYTPVPPSFVRWEF